MSAAAVFTPGTPEADAEGRRLGFRGHAVTLLDGRVVCSWSPEWRAECAGRVAEALNMLDVQRDSHVRRAHLAKVEARSGPLARKRLEDAVLLIWTQRRERRAAEMAAQEAAAFEGLPE